MSASGEAHTGGATQPSTASRIERRIRPWLVAALHGRHASRSESRILVAGLIVAWAAMGLARTGLQLAFDTIFAEDGAVFLQDARAGVAPWGVYNGYIHIAPRLLAALVAPLPLEWAATALSVLAAIVTALCAAVVLLASRTHIASRAWRIALASYVVMLPVVGGEVMNNVTHAQWYLMLAGAWLLFAPTTRWGWVVLVLAALSGPQAILLLPLALGRILVEPTRRAWSTAAAFSAAIAVQWGFVLASGEASHIAIEPLRLAEVFLERVVAGFLLGDVNNAALWEAIGSWPYAIAAGSMACLLAVFFFKASRHGNPAPILAFIALAVAFFLFCTVARSTNLAPPPWSYGQAVTGGGRYFVPSVFFLASASALALGNLRRRASKARLAPRAAAVVIAAACLTSFGTPALDREGTSWSAALQEAQDGCATQGGPMAIQTAPALPRWRMSVECRDLRPPPPESSIADHAENPY